MPSSTDNRPPLFSKSTEPLLRSEERLTPTVMPASEVKVTELEPVIWLGPSELARESGPPELSVTAVLH